MNLFSILFAWQLTLEKKRKSALIIMKYGFGIFILIYNNQAKQPVKAILDALAHDYR